MPCPVNGVFDDGAGIQFHAIHGPFFKFFKTGAVNDVADVIFCRQEHPGRCNWSQTVGVFDDFDNRIFGGPDQEVFSQPGIPFAGTTHDHQSVVGFRAAGPGPGGAVDDTFQAAAHTFFSVADNPVVFHRQSIHRFFLQALTQA